MPRDYKSAVGALNTLQSNHAVIKAIKKSGRRMNDRAIPEMLEWCRRAGHEPRDFDALNAIHIAGTKGKGSTSAFTASILAQYAGVSRKGPEGENGPILKNTGLYTSPHLRFVRERIQVNNDFISEDDFAKYFFEVWDRFEAAARKENPDLPVDEPCPKPVYFRFLTVMAFHAYLREGVDAAIVECGIGGEYDSTNVLITPKVTGITSLGIDHVGVLGTTIEDIAWHKAGIMKESAKAFTVPQLPMAMEVLRKRAVEKGVELKIVQNHPALEFFKLGLAGDFQKQNASLAIALATEYLRRMGLPNLDTEAQLPPEFLRGLEEVRWSGRCDQRLDKTGLLTWYMDCGHTRESIGVASTWFADCVQSAERSSRREAANLATNGSSPSSPLILIFNQQTRAGGPLLTTLHETVRTRLVMSHPFSHAIFCTNETSSVAGLKPDLTNNSVEPERLKELVVQHELASIWKGLEASSDDGGRGCEISVEPSIQQAITRCREIAATFSHHNVKVLIIGSVHLVGGVLEVLETEAT
ncbi:Folylpolyglutamate synthetase [Agyrium rufum]|nr:Folylpolyglutamate synthetase [Agyrium rufum]